MNIPHERTKTYYYASSAYAFKQKMEQYRKQHGLSEIYSPKVKVEPNTNKTKRNHPNIYTLT
jgi:hypothetical protein